MELQIEFVSQLCKQNEEVKCRRAPMRAPSFRLKCRGRSRPIHAHVDDDDDDDGGGNGDRNADGAGLGLGDGDGDGKVLPFTLAHLASTCFSLFVSRYPTCSCLLSISEQ